MVTMADIVGDVAVNPDAQAAVTDFLDYTEYLPSDLIRSLTLIRGLDESYIQNACAVHDLTQIYGSLPTLPATSKPDPQTVRSQISSHLDQALNACESAYAEASRLYDLTDRHQNRLKSIIAKLHALPKPPSRDPTPPPQPPTSTKRSRSGRKLENGTSTTRLTLKPPKGPTISLLHRPKHRRVTVPGEVLPPFDPDEPIASTEVSDWESDRAPSPVRPILKLKQPKPPKPASIPVERKPREPKESRETATYRKPTPPPEDAEIGSKYKPWTHLTEYEMYRLRKKMKKNHTWEPSEVMIRRELAEKGRGWENYYQAKADAQANGTKFNDIETTEKPAAPAAAPPTPALPDQVETPKLTPAIATPSTAVVPRPKSSVKKPDFKKDEKRDLAPPNKATLAAQEAELAARRLGDIGSAFKNLFSPFSSAFASLNRSASTPTANANNIGKKTVTEKSQRKRKVDEAEVSASPSAEPDPQRKRQKTIVPKQITSSVSEPISAGTIKIPLKLTINPQPATPASKSPTPAHSSRPTSVQPANITPKIEPGTPEPSRPPSRRSLAASAEPALQTTRSSRRASATPATVARRTPTAESASRLAQTAASRRSKRDAPGTVTQSSQDGGAAVSVSKRKSKPSKTNKITLVSKATTDVVVPQIRVDVDGREEIVDPDEERYCICGDVSWGEMICCEMDEKCEFGQWFHMECIALLNLPPRTVKWYCPGDRKKYRKGEISNGLVGRGIK